MIITLKNISKHYKIPGSANNREVLNNINLEIKKGDSLAITGPSGSGKSTLLNIMGTLDLPGSGKVIFKGKDVSKLDNNQLASIRNSNIGFVFQLHHLLPQLNLFENIMLPLIPQKNKNKRNEASARAMDLLESVGLADNIYQKPGQLSGGECQRAAVVRALINEPELILADEPTGSLDQESAQQLGELLSQINIEHKVAIVIVTHSTTLANKMKTTYNLSAGRLLLTTSGIYPEGVGIRESLRVKKPRES